MAHPVRRHLTRATSGVGHDEDLDDRRRLRQVPRTADPAQAGHRQTTAWRACDARRGADRFRARVSLASRHAGPAGASQPAARDGRGTISSSIWHEDPAVGEWSRNRRGLQASVEVRARAHLVTAGARFRNQAQAPACGLTSIHRLGWFPFGRCSRLTRHRRRPRSIDVVTGTRPVVGTSAPGLRRGRGV